MTTPGARLCPDEELHINYGDKSNEELLFLYGGHRLLTTTHAAALKPLCAAHVPPQSA